MIIRPAPSLPNDFHCGLQTDEWVMTDLFVNRDLVPPSSISSWQDLLKPEYKGKITSFDPRRAGSAQTTVAYLSALFGDDYLKDLYVDQAVTLTADYRQLAEEYPWRTDGLSLTQRRILAAVAHESLGLREIFRRLWHKERRPYLGDQSCYSSIRELALARKEKWCGVRV